MPPNTPSWPHPVAAIIPAYNEAPAIARVVHAARALRDRHGAPLFERVIVADNGSTDDTGGIAAAAGAVVVREPQRGYGAACLRGLTTLGPARAVVFVDGDASVPLADTGRLLAALAAGADLAIGARVSGQRRGMTLPQRFGNRLASALIRALWGARVTDLGPFRAVRRSALERIGMRDRAFGWTVEMQVRAIQLGLRIDEVPVAVLPRVGRSKISGTARGVVLAAHGIFGTIGRLWWAQRRRR